MNLMVYEKSLLVAAYLKDKAYFVEPGTQLASDAIVLIDAGLGYFKGEKFNLTVEGSDMARKLLIEFLANGFKVMDFPRT